MRTKNLLSLISVCVVTPIALCIVVSVESFGQRTDGSGFVDIWYSITDYTDGCLDITLTPVTTSGETLTCATFAEPSDTGCICADGPAILGNNGLPEGLTINRRDVITMELVREGE